MLEHHFSASVKIRDAYCTVFQIPCQTSCSKTAPIPMRTSIERSGECQRRKKANRPKQLPKSGAEQMRAFRERKKVWGNTAFQTMVEDEKKKLWKHCIVFHLMRNDWTLQNLWKLKKSTSLFAAYLGKNVIQKEMGLTNLALHPFRLLQFPQLSLMNIILQICQRKRKKINVMKNTSIVTV